MSTVSDAIFCYLKNSAEFTAHGRKISTEKFSSRFCRWNGGGPRRLQTARKRTGRRRIEFAVVREPLERFLSGFVDKCLHEKQCYSCNGDMGCFVSKLTTSLFRYYRDENSSSDFHLDHFAPQNCLFGHPFVMSAQSMMGFSISPNDTRWITNDTIVYMVKAEQRGKSTRPPTHCNFRYSLNDFRIIKYESGREGAVKLAKEFRTIFRKAGVPTEMRNIIYNEMSIGRSHHSTYGLEERQTAEQTLMSNFTLLTSVLRLFYYDYVIFGFKLPDVFRNHSTFS
ncbi:hypothetical protein Q1695_006242 [Nippostrongylus brasiliensis]|nr:hypothetical protein Q1695_006242 [Nippostrongylus brasiliensis]